jgi:glycosyltransferase involved in cell wall biosynthesis
LNYSIIIPVHNEGPSLKILISELKTFSKNNEIIIINDGSTDNSQNILNNHSFIRIISLSNRSGKGIAIREGIKMAIYDKIVITDGDLELKTSEISKLMILDKKELKYFILGNRNLKIFKSLWNIGNYLFTFFFNIINKSYVKDALCCAKSFYKSDIDIKYLESKSFDIDVELSSKLLKKRKNYLNVSLSYERRNNRQGKKLKVIDSLIILRRIFKKAN